MKTQKAGEQFRTSYLSSTYPYEKLQHSRESATPLKGSASATVAMCSGEANYI